MPKRESDAELSENESDASKSDAESESEDEKKEDEDEDIQSDDDTEVPKIEYPCTILAVGKRFAGKTNAILNLVDPSRFHNVFVFTGTKDKHDLDSIVHDDPDKCVMESCSDAWIEWIIKHAKKHEAHTLVAFDDFIGEHFDMKKSKLMKSLITKGRNWNISLLVSSQIFVELPTALRRNSEYYLLGRNTEETNEQIAKDVGSADLDKNTMREKLTKIAKRRRHEFLFLDDRTGENKVWKPLKKKK